MIETRDKKIGEHTYSVTQLPARRALRLKAKLIKLFGPSITQLLLTSLEPQENPNKEVQINEVDQVRIQEIRKDAVVKGIQLLSSSIDDKTFDELMIEITQGARMDGQELRPEIIDMTFAGNLAEFYQLIYFILEVNYSDFLVMGATGNLSESLSNLAPEPTKNAYTFRSSTNLRSGD